MSVITCTNCGETKPLDAFYYSPIQKYRLHECNDCRLEKRQARQRSARLEKSEPIIQAVTALLKKFGPMPAKDIDRMIGGKPRGIAQVMCKSGLFVKRRASNNDRLLWSVAGYDRRKNRAEKARAFAAARAAAAPVPVHREPPKPVVAQAPALAPVPPPVAAPAPVPAPPPVKRQPDQHDVWFAQLRAEVAARKAAHIVMRARV